MFSLIYFISFSITIVDDLKIDSRKAAHNWLLERPEFYDIKVGVTYSCSGASPAENISWLIKDPFARYKYFEPAQKVPYRHDSVLLVLDASIEALQKDSDSKTKSN